MSVVEAPVAAANAGRPAGEAQAPARAPPLVGSCYSAVSRGW